MKILDLVTSLSEFASINFNIELAFKLVLEKNN